MKEIPPDVFVTKIKPGHYASPIPSIDDITARRSEIFDTLPTEIPGVDLQAAEQISLFDVFGERYISDMGIYETTPKSPWRYYDENGFFSNLDASLLFCVLRFLKPNQIIEIGAGFSTALTLDTIDRFPGELQPKLTCIEPYPTRLNSLLQESDHERLRLIDSPVESVKLDTFDELNAGDILFIDSTHVLKVGSDVAHLIFRVLPRLKVGVWVHFHDIFYPFEYPESWFHLGRAWNEAYALRAFLQFNEHFTIRAFPSYILRCQSSVFERNNWPLLPSLGCHGSIWLQKVR